MNVFVRVILLLLLEGLFFLFVMTREFVSKHANVCLMTFVSTSNYEASFSSQVLCGLHVEL